MLVRKSNLASAPFVLLLNVFICYLVEGHEGEIVGWNDLSYNRFFDFRQQESAVLLFQMLRNLGRAMLEHFAYRMLQDHCLAGEYVQI